MTRQVACFLQGAPRKLGVRSELRCYVEFHGHKVHVFLEQSLSRRLITLLSAMHDRDFKQQPQDLHKP